MTIEIKNLSKRFNSKNTDLPVLEDINLTIETGKFVCFIGPSGCGKTTLLRIIAGFEKASNGEVITDNIKIDEPSKDRGFIFQQYSLFPWLNVLDNVTFGLDDSNSFKNKERAIKYLKAVGLGEFAYNYPHELSGGMKQRVAIIRSVINNCKILLMDEPFSALDMQTKKSLQEQIVHNWTSKRRTILFVTHDVDEAVYLADEIVIFSNRPGKIKKIIKNNLPRPRNRENHEYQDIQIEVMKYIDKPELI